MVSGEENWAAGRLHGIYAGWCLWNRKACVTIPKHSKMCCLIRDFHLSVMVCKRFWPLRQATVGRLLLGGHYWPRQSRAAEGHPPPAADRPKGTLSGADSWICLSCHNEWVLPGADVPNNRLSGLPSESIRTHFKPCSERHW